VKLLGYLILEEHGNERITSWGCSLFSSGVSRSISLKEV